MDRTVAFGAFLHMRLGGDGCRLFSSSSWVFTQVPRRPIAGQERGDPLAC